jgi:predicted ArsR family transcriptional regulator
VSLQPFRVHQLARVAALKIASGHDVTASVQAAIVAALGEDMELPACFGSVTPQQREVILALYGSGTQRPHTLAAALRISYIAALHRLEDLVRLGLVTKPQPGLYHLTKGHGMTLRARRGALDREQHLVAWLQDRGETTPAAVAEAFGCSSAAASRRLRRLVDLGHATIPRFGTYRAIRRRCA